MSRLRSHPIRAKAALGALLLLVGGVVACDEDGKTAPARCLDPALPIFDIQAAGAPADDNAKYPCVTEVGHAISQGPSTTPTPSTAGSAGKGGSGSGSGGDPATAGAGAGGAP